MVRIEDDFQNNRIPVSELSERDITPGTTIEGIKTLDEFELFIRTLATALTEANSTSDVPLASSLKQSRLREIKKQFVEQGTRRHFNGTLNNLNVTVLQFDDIPNRPDLKGSLKPNHAATFIVEADMHSSGRGKVGSLKRLTSLYFSFAEDAVSDIFLPDGQRYQSRELMLTSRPIDEQNSREQIDRLIRNSNMISTLVWRDAFRRMASAGLPSLGKRR